MAELARTVDEFEKMLADEAACLEFLRQHRWPKGFCCPRCSGTERWQLRARPMDECRACGHQVSLTAGTLFAGTRKPLRIWFRVIADFLTDKRGCSALLTARKHGLSYQTAWTWLHKIRSLMDRDGIDTLYGFVQLDPNLDTQPVKRCTLTAVGAVQKARPAGCARIRLSSKWKTAEDWCDFAVANIAEASSLEVRAFKEFELLKGYPLKVTRGRMFLITSVFRLLRRQLIGTYHGSVSPKHYQRYLDEFTFRFNRRTSRNRWHLFDRLVASSRKKVPTFRSLVGGT